MRYIAILFFCAFIFIFGETIFGPENFDSGVMPSGWFAPTYNSPMYVYNPGFESDYGVGSGPMSWPDWWGNFVRTPIVDCSTADSVIMSFRMYNTAYADDYARFYIWVEPTGYADSTFRYNMDITRDWELIIIDFTEWAAGESQVYFYLEGNFGSDSYTHEVKFDDVAIDTRTVLSTHEYNEMPEKPILVTHPNPFNSSVSICLNAGNKCACPKTIEIYDLQGTLRLHSMLGTREFVWYPSEMISSGIYFICIRMKDGQAVSKPVVYIQ